MKAIDRISRVNQSPYDAMGTGAAMVPKSFAKAESLAMQACVPRPLASDSSGEFRAI